MSCKMLVFVNKPPTVREPIKQTSDATIASAKETERSNAIVERNNDDITKSGQSFSVVHPQRIRPAVETAAVDPHLIRQQRKLP